ncbi:lysozyme inhibitor LprI family protein [Sphingomonas sp. SRS2]|uniref:lysozyme inhibitor LprI family protein n=1 Tax=Sphingomonas sp. SRS2 TaxID=133190 RepID=UPI00061849BE|nr:hypothetical protein [Sphingomonas sp. SRS2]KKC27780.1 hypothetical protein WP12_00940 [Sphingomonas sp. SRS2]
MKIAALLLVSLSILSAAHGAQARGIDCSKAATKLDRAICADPAALDYDRRMAAAYGIALASWNGAITRYVRLDQQEWFTGFRTIELEAAIDSDCVVTDPACIRDELRRRVEAMESGSYTYSGVYRAAGGMKLLLHPGRANGYRVRVYDPARAARINIVTVGGERAALWDGPQFMVTTMGDSNGLPLPKEDGCTLRMLPEALAIRVFQNGACGGQIYEGTYHRLLDETLRSYELELH